MKADAYVCINSSTSDARRSYWNVHRKLNSFTCIMLRFNQFVFLRTVSASSLIFFFNFSHNFSTRFVLKLKFFFRCQFHKISISETRKKHFCISNTFLRFRMSCFMKKIQVFWSKHSVYCSCYYMFYLLHTHTIIFKFDGNKITLQKNCSRFLWFLY